ncbi:MAG: SpoVR family protein [Candidatus Wallbacteria bacterium]|nr:SpoVR family protein [Candidatus Wallbacteria bacterium]
MTEIEEIGLEEELEASLPPGPSMVPTEETRLSEYAREIEQLTKVAEGFGLSFHPISFRRASRDNLSLVASFGLPNRFSHWYFGGIYKNLKMQQDEQLFSILELVLNTNPVYAFLLDTNSHLENLVVIAHVLGHVDFFKNNCWYARSDQNMLNKCELHSRTLRHLSDKFGKEKVDAIIAAALTVCGSVNTFEQNPHFRRERLLYFLNEQLERRVRKMRKSDPAWADAYLGHKVLSMICEETEYFDLIGRTQIINEGWASYIEFKVLEKFLDPGQWLAFSLLFSKRPPPYLIGFTLFDSIFRQRGWDGVLQVRRSYEDIAFVDQFLTQDLSRRLDLFMLDRESVEKDYDARKVKERIIEEKLFKGEPQVKVSEFNDDTLAVTLKHADEERTLDKKRCELFLKEVHLLWPHEVTLLDNENIYRINARGFSLERK